MAQDIPTVPKNVALAWRKFLGSNEGQYGIDFLRRFHFPRASGKHEGELIKGALTFEGYMDCLSDIENLLTDIPVAPKSLDEPPLESI